MKFEKCLAVMALIVAVLFFGYCAPAKASDCNSGVAVFGVPVVTQFQTFAVVPQTVVQVQDFAVTNRARVSVNRVRVNSFGGFGSRSFQFQSSRSRGFGGGRSSVSRTVIRVR